MQDNCRWHGLEDADQIAIAASQHILNAAERAIADHGTFKLVLAGGKTPEKIYRMLAQADTDWAKWVIYYGDERCLHVDHPDRNSVMASESLLGKVPIPSSQIYTMPTEMGCEQAAAYYRPLVSAAIPFDMVLLGMGEDGHTASLFPGHQHDENELVHAVYNSPKPPPERITLSASALSNSQDVVVLIAGGNKQDTVKSWQQGENLPIASIQPKTPIDIYILREFLHSETELVLSSNCCG